MEVCRRPEVEEACPESEAQAFFGPDLANIWTGLKVSEVFHEPEVEEVCSGPEAADAASFCEV